MKIEKKPQVKITTAAVIKEPGNSVKNKTGNWRSMRPIRDKKKCTKCHICWQFCPDNAITTDIEFDYDYCKGCAICATVCPFKAIHMEPEEK